MNWRGFAAGLEGAQRSHGYAALRCIKRKGTGVVHWPSALQGGANTLACGDFGIQRGLVHLQGYRLGIDLAAVE
ncbi:hypothetical protein GCM10010971_31890 [Silvimonas amylolytica]|uniref:Uncharacterized protein n=1 Tax=Silvimonas amylolytica TaxID=449663 RepID=A0ABQ2PPN1_9NEIS|nr:hypothetical protein GCM10010971_31890 [Silvimonas amylolytica]